MGAFHPLSSLLHEEETGASPPSSFDTGPKRVGNEDRLACASGLVNSHRVPFRCFTGTCSARGGGGGRQSVGPRWWRNLGASVPVLLWRKKPD